MVLSYLLFSYYYFKGWWYSGIGTMLILCFAYLLWRQDYLVRVGLKINCRILVFSLLLTLILSVAGYLLMNIVAQRNEVIIHYSDFRNYIHDLFYTLNEEIILGAVLLGLVKQICKKLHPSVFPHDPIIAKGSV